MGETTPAGRARHAAPTVRRRWLRGLLGLVALAVLVAPLLATDPLEPLDHLDAHRPANIAHAGAQGHVPPNTVEAFEAAVDLGADTLEMDLQFTADDDVVVHHDGTVDRQTDGSGAIREMTLDEVQALDAGYAFTDDEGGHPFRGQGITIPTLEQVFEAFPDAFMVLEMKTDSGQEIVEATTDLVREHGRQDAVILASFDLAYVEEARERLPGVPTTMPEDEARDFHVLQVLGLHRWWQPPGELLQVPEFHEGIHVTTHRLFAAADEIGTDAHVWTVNDRDAMHRHLAAGAHGIITDYPDRVVEVVDERTAGAPRPGADRGDVAAIEWVQAQLPGLAAPLRAVTHLGGAGFYLLVLPVAYWAVSRRAGLRLAVAMLVSAGLAEVAKVAVRAPRPSFLDPGLGLAGAVGAGLPSATAQNAVVFWGAVAAAARRRGVWIAAAAVVALLALSRLYLGVAYPAGLLAGVVAGAVLLLAYLRLGAPVAAWIAARRPAAQVSLGIAAAAVLIALGVAARLVFLDWQPPVDWVGIDAAGWPVGLSHVAGPAGALVGLAAGSAWLRARGGFSVAGPWGQRLLRCAVGLVGVVVLWQGLGAVFPSGEDPVALVYEGLRYAAVAGWVAGAAPMWFVRLRLADAEAREATAAAEVA